MPPLGSSHVRAIVTARRDLTADLRIVRIRPESPVIFAPGQYLTIGLPINSRLTRTLSDPPNTRHQSLENVLGLRPRERLAFVAELVASGSAVEFPIDFDTVPVHAAVPSSGLCF